MARQHLHCAFKDVSGTGVSVSGGANNIGNQRGDLPLARRSDPGDQLGRIDQSEAFQQKLSQLRDVAPSVLGAGHAPERFHDEPVATALVSDILTPSTDSVHDTPFVPGPCDRAGARDEHHARSLAERVMERRLHVGPDLDRLRKADSGERIGYCVSGRFSARPRESDPQRPDW